VLRKLESCLLLGILEVVLYDILLFILGIFTGGTAAIVGFGIGSFLTPVLAIKTGFGVAVAAVGIAHFVGSLLRFWLFRQEVNRRVLLGFGILSAAGGLAGALLQGAGNAALAIVFGGLMVLAGVSNIFGWSDRLNVTGPMGWIAGLLSGFFGGLVGNQGGLRAAGLMGFRLTKTQFVATATAVALVVDVFRVPVYVVTRGAELKHLVPQIGIMSVGVVVGTLLGSPLLRRLPERYFKAVLSVILIVVGLLVAIRV
jgi:uncharacterized membrane protein YfcA